MTKALLALEDGTLFEGLAFGAPVMGKGEVCFNTSMTGYQEILTDPSYTGQIVTMTYPEIGNYGINLEDIESKKIQVSGFVVKNLCPYPSNYRSLKGQSPTGFKTLDSYLKEQGIPGIQGIDTRKLVRILREKGALQGVILHEPYETIQAVALARSLPSMAGQDLAQTVTTLESYSWDLPENQLVYQSLQKWEGDFHIVALDFGIKYNILRKLNSLGAKVTVVPAKTSASEILKLDPDGVFLSNGPGDPEPLDYAIQTVKDLIGKVPIYGICLGHQILSLALGGKTYKLKFGHRGANHPIKNLETSTIAISSQNHGFAVDPASLKNTEAIITHLNLNDNTVAGIRHKTLPVFSVQYHPEASPGPRDSEYLFIQFAKSVVEFQKSKSVV